MYRVVVLTLLAGLAAITVGLANRSVYSKEVVDDKIEHVVDRDDLRHQLLDKEIGYMHQDIRWLVRDSGGVPSAEAKADSNTP